MLLVINLQKNGKMSETLAHEYSSDSNQQKLSNEHQHDRVWMVFRELCVIVLSMKVGLALEWLSFGL